MRWLAFAGAVCAALGAAPAQAQTRGDFQIWPEVLLGPQRSPEYLQRGAGSPSVAYDSLRQRYIMAFEVRLADDDPLCPVGLWGLGIAWSDDGVTDWRPAKGPLLTPDAGTFYGCVAAHPSILFDPDADQAIIWFKGEQTEPPDPAIGPHRYTGVGRLTVQFNSRGAVREVEVDPDPVLEIPRTFGFPKVIRDGDTYRISVSIRPDIWLGSGPGDRFRLGRGPVLEASPDNPYWAVDELFNAALVCETGRVFPYSLFVGGRDLGPGGMILLGGWGKAISSNLREWFLGATPYFQWTGDLQWRHWDVLRIDDRTGPNYLVYYDERGPRGLNRIRMATTLPAWDDFDVYDKSCPE